VRECESTARCTTENAVLLLTNFSNAWEVRKRSKATTQDRRRRRKRHRVKRPHQHRACVRWSESLSIQRVVGRGRGAVLLLAVPDDLEPNLCAFIGLW
jgi:hypothetical protein